MSSLAKRVSRVFDSRPIAAHLYVTEKCNLRCGYCTEYDNAVPTPSLEVLRRRIDRIRELGCLRVGLQGGEPLLHPEIAAVVRHVKESGMGCSLATNGFLLTEETVRRLEEAGLDDLHVSVDRLTETAESRKCLDLLRPKLELLRGARVRCHLTSVLYDGSVGELRELFAAADEIGFSIKAHLVHAGVEGGFPVGRGDAAPLLDFIDWEIREKRRGRRIRSSYGILAYQRALLTGEPVEWTCLAGYKYFFVSAQGAFWTCSMRREPAIDFSGVTARTLRSFEGPKPCQRGCGVYCVVSESFVNSHPLRYLRGELFRGA